MLWTWLCQPVPACHGAASLCQPVKVFAGVVIITCEQEGSPAGEGRPHSVCAVLGDARVAVRCLQGSSSSPVSRRGLQLARDALAVCAQCLVTRLLRAAGAAVTMPPADAKLFLRSVIGSVVTKGPPCIAQMLAVVRACDFSRLEQRLRAIPPQLQPLVDALAAVCAATEVVFSAGKVPPKIYMGLSSQLVAMIETLTNFTQTSSTGYFPHRALAVINFL